MSKLIEAETLVTFRRPFAEARRAANPETWFAEGVVGIVLRVDEVSKWSSRPGVRYFVMWERPGGQTLTNYLPASAIKEIR